MLQWLVQWHHSESSHDLHSGKNWPFRPVSGDWSGIDQGEFVSGVKITQDVLQAVADVHMLMLIAVPTD